MELFSIIISVISLIISTVLITKGWSKQRNIYGIELYDIYGNNREFMREASIATVNERLNSGAYAILHTEKKEDSYFGSGYQILLGKIKE